MSFLDFSDSSRLNELVNVAENALQQIENGPYDVSIEELAALCDAQHVNGRPDQYHWLIGKMIATGETARARELMDYLIQRDDDPWAYSMLFEDNVEKVMFTLFSTVTPSDARARVISEFLTFFNVEEGMEFGNPNVQLAYDVFMLDRA